MVERCKLAVQAVRLLGAFHNSENQQAEFTGKLRLIHYHTEQSHHIRHRQLVCTAAKGAQYQRILAMLHAHAEDGADFVQHNLLALRGEATISGSIADLFHTAELGSSVEAQSSYGDHIALEDGIPQGKELGFTVAEEGHIGGIDTTEVPIQRIAWSLRGNAAFPDMLKFRAAILVQRQAQV